MKSELKLTFRQKRKKFNVYSITFVGSKVDWNRIKKKKKRDKKLNRSNWRISFEYMKYVRCSKMYLLFFFPPHSSLSILFINHNFPKRQYMCTIYDNINFTERSRNHYCFDYGKPIKIDALYYSCQVYTCTYISIVAIKWYSIYRWRIVNTQKLFIRNGLNFTLFGSLNFLTGN